MNTFRYKALNPSGKMVSGTLEAEDRKAALYKLSTQNLKPLSITALTTQSKAKETPPSEKGRSFGISNREITLSFLTKLHQLHSSGMPIGDAVRILQQRINEPKQKQIATSLWNDLSEGLTLANSMKKFPKVFGESIIYPIEAGEATGNIAPILEDIVKRLLAEDALRRNIYAGLGYPIFVSILSIGVVAFFLYFLLPRIQGMMASLGGKMTTSAQILIGIANFLIKGGPFILVAGLIAFIALLRWRKTNIGRFATDAWLLRIPLLGTISHESVICGSCNLMATLLRSGVNTTEAMKLTERAISNTVLRAEFQEAREKINDGLSFSAAFKNYSFFPDTAIDILTVGESTGDLAKSFEETYKIYNQELSLHLKRITTLISTLALGFALSLVAILAFSIVTSILQFSNSIMHR